MVALKAAAAVLTAAWQREKYSNKVVIVLGATGTGKSRLSIDLAAVFPAEIVNCDKIQVYRGLSVVTNKVTEEEQEGVPHHLLGVVDPDEDFSAVDFRKRAAEIVDQIHRRRKLPILAGGSNTFIEEFVKGTKYEFCFLWLDVEIPVLHSFVSERVDKMVEMGMVDEVREMFREDGDYSRGIRRAIGVPELDGYLRRERCKGEERDMLLREAVEEIKENTRKLACRQLQKIKRMAWAGWDLHRLEATEAFLLRGGASDEAWRRRVSAPGVEIVKRFLNDERERERSCSGRGERKERDPFDSEYSVPFLSVS